MASFSWLCLVSLLFVGLSGYLVQADEAPTFSQCKVHIEAAIKDIVPEAPLDGETDEVASVFSNEHALSEEDQTEGLIDEPVDEEPLPVDEPVSEEPAEEEPEAVEEPEASEPEVVAEAAEEQGGDDEDDDDETANDDTEDEQVEEPAAEAEPAETNDDDQENSKEIDDEDDEEPTNDEAAEDKETAGEADEEEGEASAEEGEASAEEGETSAEDGEASAEEGEASAEEADGESSVETADDEEGGDTTEEAKHEEVEATEADVSGEEDEAEVDETGIDAEEAEPEAADEVTEPTPAEAEQADLETDAEPEPDNAAVDEEVPVEAEPNADEAAPVSAEDGVVAEPDVAESAASPESGDEAAAEVAEASEAEVEAEAAPLQAEAAPVEEAPFEGIIEEEPEVRRPRDHIAEILRLEEESENQLLKKNAIQVTLREVKKVIENAVRPLEEIYKYKDVSNRHFGDSEVFSKPLVLFLGPWSGGKSSIINYLLGTEFTKNALKSGAEPSATYFQIMMHGDEEEHLDGTQLAADWTFSGLQKFGQAFIDRLRGKKLPNKILQKANIVEIPGILEMRREVERTYPFNDVVQWFVDRADLIFVVYDPTKLDMGLEHEAVFDQLKGRQNQVRVLLNKADTVSQEELLLIQNNLMWQLSPLLASPLPPVVYAGSFWSKPYNTESPTRLLRAHEENMLNDIREALDNVVENTIAEARRHAVRVRNHAKMVDCYLTTFFNHKGYFGNKKTVMDDIIDNPHHYHIFEGLSTLTNISRYDLPDADVYRDFFKVHNLYEFQNLASTCSFFRGCPIDKLDVAISYELPELIGKYKKRLQQIKAKKGTKSS